METCWNHERTERASSSPACCRERSGYPPGYTVFECRLDGNQPIAQVVQVPPDTRDNILQNKTCMILETKQSEFGPCSRVAAYPGEKATRSASDRVQAPGAMSFALETRDSPGGAVACAGKIAQRVNSPMARPMTLLETTKGSAHQDGPSSRLTYGPVSNEVAPASRAYKPSAFYIHCTTTPEGPLARVTQVPQEFAKSSGDPGTRYETFVNHDGSCPTAKATQFVKNNGTDVQQACEYLESRVCSSGPRATALTLPDGSSDVRHFTHLNVRPSENGPSAKISQYPADHQRTILNTQDHASRVKPKTACCCDPVTRPVPILQSPRKSSAPCNSKRTANWVPCVADRRNGLSPRSGESNDSVGHFKRGRITKPIGGKTPTTCLPQNRHSSSSPDRKHTPCPNKQLTSACPPPPCLCPLQPCFKALERPRSSKNPLPGGSVYSRCPAPSLPDIAPVPLGPYRLRDYKPRPKTTRARNTSVSKKRRDDNINKAEKPPKKKPKKKSKNKGTDPREEDKKAPELPEAEADTELPRIPSESSEERPALVSKGNQSDPIQKEPVYVQCPAYENKSIQSGSPEEPLYVRCPAYESKRKKSTQRFEEPSYVRCPAFDSKKSSETSSKYGLTDDEVIGKYPRYFRSKTVETLVTCRAKRNGFQDECHLHIPESMLRMKYEPRERRNARTLVSSCRRRHGFEDEVNQVSQPRYCVRSELSAQ